jgi:hypothetical protein
MMGMIIADKSDKHKSYKNNKNIQMILVDRFWQEIKSRFHGVNEKLIFKITEEIAV